MHFYRGGGAAAAAYFEEGHDHAEAYYTEGGEVLAWLDTWAGGSRVGESVGVVHGDLVAWVEGVELSTGEVKGVIRSGGPERLPLRFVEVVVNNPKSLSIVASQNPAVAAALDAVLDRQGDEIARYLSSVAVTRVGGRGAQVEVGGLELQTARVRHLTSREGDPHRHVHLLVNTRVRTAAGEWRGLHSAAIRQHISAVNELGSRVLVTDLALRAVLAAQGYTLGADGEVDQAREAVALMSKRSAQVSENRELAEAAWRAEHPGREPSQRVRNGWDQQGWADGRRAKPRVRESPAEMAERVRLELGAAGMDFTPGARLAIGWEQGMVPAGEASVVVSVGQVDRDRVASDAVAVLSGRRSAWAEAELTAQVEAAVAATGVVGDPRAVAGLVEDCRARAAELCVSVLDAEVWAPTAMSRHLTSEAVIAADTALNLGFAGLAGSGPGASTLDLGGRDAEGRDLEGPPAEGARGSATAGLDAGQAAAVAAVCGQRRLEVVVGPAGTGKTRMLSAAKEVLGDQGREVVVVSPTRKGAMVAGAEVGVAGVALSKVLYDHGFRWDTLGRWHRLGVGEVDEVTGRAHQTPTPGGPGASSVLTDHSVVVVDEAGLMTVDQANALVDVAAETGAAVRLVGDPRQLGAVGRGGVMETAARWSGGAVTLDQVHRFLRLDVDAAGLPAVVPDREYAELSLLIRDGTDPNLMAAGLVERGAVTVHSSRADAVAAIAAEVAAQSEAAALAVTVATNEEAQEVNEAVRALRLAAGVVDDTHVALGMGGERIGAGDRITTRRNDTTRGVTNRESWVVDAVTADGTLLAHPAEGSRDRRVRLDAGYVADHAQLGYATTDYGNQGVTTERSLTWVTEATTAGGLYVGVTRGRYDNDLHVVAGTQEVAVERLVAAAGRDRVDRGLDAARAIAEADAVRAETAARSPAAVGWRPPDPATWPTEAELDAAAAAIEADLITQLRRLPLVAMMPDNARAQDDRADREAAAACRARAVEHQWEAARVAAGLDQLIEQATAEHMTARDDARTIAAGPGRFGGKAERVQAALARNDDFARRWPRAPRPEANWSDDAVRAIAGDTARRVVGTAVNHHVDWSAHEVRRADGYEKDLSDRDAKQRSARQINEGRNEQRAGLVAEAEQRLAVIAGLRETREAKVATMTPEQVTLADQTREAYVAERSEQDRERSGVGPVVRINRPTPDEIARQHAIAQQALHPPIERGHGIEM